MAKDLATLASLAGEASSASEMDQNLYCKNLKIEVCKLRKLELFGKHLWSQPRRSSMHGDAHQW